MGSCDCNNIQIDSGYKIITVYALKNDLRSGLKLNSYIKSIWASLKYEINNI